MKKNRTTEDVETYIIKIYYEGRIPNANIFNYAITLHVISAECLS